MSAADRGSAKASPSLGPGCLQRDPLRMRTHRIPEAADPFGTGEIDAGVMYARYEVAAVSMKPKPWDKAYNADRMEELFCRAAREYRAQLVVAPECVLDGYVVFDAIWHQKERAAALVDIAESLDGKYLRRFRKLARMLRVCLCFGFAQRLGRDGACNAAVFIDDRGEIRGTYQKLSEGCGAHPSWRFWQPGRRVRAFDTPLGRCGIMICSDRWIPLVARTLALDGARLLLVPTYGTVGRSQNAAVLRRARENGVAVVQANAAGHNLIVSRGDIVAYERGVNRITSGFVDVPHAPSPATARAAEREFLRFQRGMERLHYAHTRKQLKKGKASTDVRRGFTAPAEFERLRACGWGENVG